jgi:hypothetical protein
MTPALRASDRPRHVNHLLSALLGAVAAHHCVGTIPDRSGSPPRSPRVFLHRQPEFPAPCTQSPQRKKRIEEMRRIALTGAMTILAGATIMLATPANAGCQTISLGIFGGGEQCDGPVDQLGNFTRCASGNAMGFGGSNCFVVSVSDPGRSPHTP